MDKTSEKVTKDPKRQERGRKSHETYMKSLKENILEDNQLPTLTPTDMSMPSIPSSTPPISSSTGDPTSSISSHTARTNDTYVYGIGILAVLAIGVCVFLQITLLRLKIKNLSVKNNTKHQNDVIRPYIIN